MKLKYGMQLPNCHASVQHQPIKHEKKLIGSKRLINSAFAPCENIIQ